MKPIFFHLYIVYPKDDLQAKAHLPHKSGRNYFPYIPKNSSCATSSWSFSRM